MRIRVHLKEDSNDGLCRVLFIDSTIQRVKLKSTKSPDIPLVRLRSRLRRPDDREDLNLNMTV